MSETLEQEKSYKFYKCSVCGYVYDELEGDEENDIPAGTLFEDLPDDWNCPICSAEKEDFNEL